MINTPVNELEERRKQPHPAAQFLIFTGIFLIVLIVGNLIGAGIATALYGINTVMSIAQGNLTSPHVVNALWIVQIAGTTIPIFSAAVFYAWVIAKDPQEYINRIDSTWSGTIPSTLFIRNGKRVFVENDLTYDDLLNQYSALK